MCDGKWLYSSKTTEIVENYWEKFPEVFEYLQGSSSMDCTVDDVFGTEDGEHMVIGD